MENIYAVIMAGGRGERFWPLSTTSKPKQLHELVGEKPLIAQAVDRLEGLVTNDKIFIITNINLVEDTISVVPNLNKENIIGEPVGRDTAAAVACAAALVKSKNKDAIFCILTADQVMKNVENFQSTLKAGFQLASKNNVLITIGIKPTFPATGFGYIESDDEYTTELEIEFKNTKRFVEKPSFEKASSYLETGKFYWNSGMFIWSVSSIEDALKKHAPIIYELMNNLYSYACENKILIGMDEYYPDFQKISIDYALMEKTDNIIMACGIFDWDDVGNWNALENHFNQDKQNNTLIGDILQLNSENNIVYSKEHLTALIGVKDLIVVQTDDVTLVCSKDKSQEIKAMVEKVRKDRSDSSLI